MSDHVLYLRFPINPEDVDQALEAALNEEGTQLSDEQFDAVFRELPQGVSVKVFFEDDDVEGSFDILDMDVE